MNKQVLDCELNLNANSNLPKVKFIERNLLNSVFASPTTHEGSNNSNFLSTLPLEKIGTMFGTQVNNNGQPEHTTIGDPPGWSFVDFDAQLFRNHSSQDLSYWLDENMNGKNIHGSHSKTQNDLAVKDSNSNICNSISPKYSKSSFDFEEFIGSAQLDEDEIKMEIEKIFAELEVQTDHDKRKEIVGNILKDLILKYGLLRVYITLKVVEDQLNLESKQDSIEKTENITNYTQKCTIIEITSNESVMQQMSEDILHALFLNTNVHEESSMCNIMDVEMIYETDMSDKNSALNFSGSFSDSIQKTDQLLSNKTENRLEPSPVPGNQKVKAIKNPKTKSRIRNKFSQNRRPNVPSRGYNKVEIDKQYNNCGTECLSRTDSKSVNKSHSRELSSATLKTDYCKQSEVLGLNSIDFNSQETGWRNQQRFNDREKLLATSKKRMIGNVKQNQTTNVQDNNHFTDKIKESRLKLRKQNQAYFVSRGQTPQSNAATYTLIAADEQTLCSQNTEGNEHEMSEEIKQAEGIYDEPFENISEDNKEANNLIHGDDDSYPVVSENKTTVEDIYDEPFENISEDNKEAKNLIHGADDSYLDVSESQTTVEDGNDPFYKPWSNCQINSNNQKTLKNISCQTDPITVSNSKKWIEVVIMSILFICVLCFGHVYLTETNKSFPDNKQVTSTFLLHKCFKKIKSLYMSGK